MAETPADVRRDIELTRERMSTTINELEQKLNVKQLIADNPWPAVALALGAGLALAQSRSETKVVAAAAAATKGAGSKLGDALDDVVTNLMATATSALHQQVDQLVAQLKTSMVSGQHQVATPSREVVRAD